MSQILSVTPPLEALTLQMIADGTSTASGSFYGFELSDDSLFEVTEDFGSSMSVSASDNTIILKKGIYQLFFSAGIRTGAGNVYGLSQTTLRISNDPSFNEISVINDQANQWYGNGSSGNMPIFFDMNSGAIMNITQDDTPLAFQIRNTNAASVNFYISGSDTIPTTKIQIVRLGDMLS